MFKKGYKQTEEHKEKIRQAITGIVRSKETCEKISKSKTGKTHKGFKHSEETKKRLSEIAKQGFKNGRIPYQLGKSRFKNEEEKRLCMLEHGRKSYRKHIKTRLIYYRKLAFKRRNSPGSFTKEEWDNKLKEYDYKCAYCGISEIELLKITGMGLTIDHIIPISKGGTSNIDNLQPLCKKCNCRKSNKLLKVKLILDN